MRAIGWRPKPIETCRNSSAALRTLRPHQDRAVDGHQRNVGFSGTASFLNRPIGGWNPTTSGWRETLGPHVTQFHDLGDLWVLTRYVHLNPVRAGLAATPEAWIWSSCPGYFRRRDRLDWVAYDALLAPGPASSDGPIRRHPTVASWRPV